MTPDEIRAAFDPFIRLLRDGHFVEPADGWSGEQVGAHVARNNDEFSRVAEALANHEPADYDNAIAVDQAELQHAVDRLGDRAAVVAAVEASVDRLARAVAALDADLLRRDVHLRIRHDGDVVHDGPGAIGEWLDRNATMHVAMHVRQLQALQES
jgi:hypothetical protein